VGVLVCCVLFYFVFVLFCGLAGGGVCFVGLWVRLAGGAEEMGGGVQES